MTKSIEAQAEEYYKKSGWAPTENAVMNFKAGAKSRDAEWLKVVNELKDCAQDIIKNKIVLNQLKKENEQLKADARTSELNRQSLWADSVKMADELNYLKAKTDTEIQQLKSKLEVAKKGLEFYADGEGDVLDWSGVNNSAYIQVKGKRAKQTLLEIEDVE